MKSLILLVFTIISFRINAQTKEIHFKKEKIKNISELNEIISDIPKDCKVSTFIFSVSSGGSLKEFVCSGGNGGIAQEVKNLISSKANGEWFFVEKIKSDCEKSHKQNYKIILE